MRSQQEIQTGMTTLIRGLAARKVSNADLPLPDVLNEHPDIKEQWDVLLKEAEELRSKGLWKSQ